MFRVTKDQLAALAADRLADFEERLREDVRRHPMTATAVAETPDPVLTGRLRSALDRARRHGFSTEIELARYVRSELALGEGFESDPLARPAALVLRSRAVAPDERSELLETVSERIRQTRHELVAGGER